MERIPTDDGANQAARDEAVKYNEEIADAAFLRRVRFKELSAGGCGRQSYGRQCAWLGSHDMAASRHTAQTREAERLVDVCGATSSCCSFFSSKRGLLQ